MNAVSVVGVSVVGMVYKLQAPWWPCNRSPYSGDYIDGTSTVTCMCAAHYDILFVLFAPVLVVVAPHWSVEVKTK